MVANIIAWAGVTFWGVMGLIMWVGVFWPDMTGSRRWLAMILGSFFMAFAYAIARFNGL